MDPGCIR